MGTYIFLMFFSVAAFFLLRFVRNAKIENVLMLLWLIVIVFISGFRVDLGQDYEGYAYNYQNLDARESVEPFIIFVTKILNYFSLPYIFLFFVFSFFTFFFLLKFLKSQNREILYLIILIFIAIPHYYFQTYNLIRQMLAVVLFAYASTFISSKWKYFCYIFFCFIIHWSVLFVMPIVLILERYKSFKLDKLLYIASLILFFNTSFMRSIVLSLGAVLHIKYAELYMSIYTIDNFKMSLGPMLYMNIIFTAFILFNKEKFVSMGMQREYNYFVVGQILFNLLSWDRTLIRISYYFVFFYIVLIPSLVLLFKKEDRVVIQFVLLIIYLSFFFATIMGSNNPLSLYKNYFFN